jgi:ABC-2 type transport system ATP-binding protein
VRSRVSLTGQFAAVDGDLTGVENLVLVGRLLGLSRADAKRRASELLESFELSTAAGRLARTYSGGMRRRLDIAGSLVTPPEVLVLDEPTTGLNPRSRHDVWDIVRALTGAGTTVLLTTQYLAEADELADRIAVLDHGKVIAEGTAEELKASIGGGRLRVGVRDPQQRPAAQRALSEALSTDVELGIDAVGLVARIGDADRAAAAVAGLAGAGIAVSDFAHDQPTLDEVFFALTGTEREVSA